eukprot:1552640-Pleurochrysis_carterae.AAC.6
MPAALMGRPEAAPSSCQKLTLLAAGPGASALAGSAVDFSESTRATQARHVYTAGIPVRTEACVSAGEGPVCDATKPA